MRQSAVTFKAKGLNFEGVVATPDADGGPYPGVVMCHPHPLFGGNMDNNVVLAVTFELVQQGFATLRFNFRGVGNSEGEHTKGELEYQEVLGALDFMKAWKGVDGGTLGLIRVLLRHFGNSGKRRGAETAQGVCLDFSSSAGPGVHTAQERQAAETDHIWGPGQASPIRATQTGSRVLLASSSS